MSPQWKNNIKMAFNACRYAVSPSNSSFKMTTDLRHFIALGGFHNSEFEGKSIYDLGIEEGQIDFLQKDTRGENILFTAINSSSTKAVEIIVQMARRDGKIEELLQAQRDDGKTAIELVDGMRQLASQGAPKAFVKAWEKIHATLNGAAEHLQMKKRFQAMKQA